MGIGMQPGEAGTAFNVVPVFQNEAKVYLTKNYLQRIEDSIRQRTPIAGPGINIKTTEGCYNISVSTGFEAGEPIVLTVCSNGQPTVITVVRYSG